MTDTLQTISDALEQAAQYLEAVPDDRLNAEHVDREAVAAVLRRLSSRQEAQPVAWQLLNRWATFAESLGMARHILADTKTFLHATPSPNHADGGNGEGREAVGIARVWSASGSRWNVSVERADLTRLHDGDLLYTSPPAVKQGDGLESLAQICLDERVDAEATGASEDRAYNQACEDCSRAILEASAKPVTPPAVPVSVPPELLGEVPEGWMRDEAQVKGLAEHLENQGWRPNPNTGEAECYDQGAAMGAEVIRRVLLPILHRHKTNQSAASVPVEYGVSASARDGIKFFIGQDEYRLDIDSEDEKFIAGIAARLRNQLDRIQQAGRK